MHAILRRFLARCLFGSLLAGSPWAAAQQIPAQPLQQALAAFADATHLELVYVSQLALGKMSQSVPAGLPASETLSRLLEGTGLTFLYLNRRTIKVFERLETVSVAAPSAARESRADTDTYADAPGSSLIYAYTLRPRTIGLTGNWSF